MASRSDIETVLLSRRKAIMEFVGMDVATVGTNTDLNDAIGFSVRNCGGKVESIIAVTDADLGTVPDDEIDKLLDVAEYRLIFNILGNMDEVSVSVAGQSESYSEIRATLESQIGLLSTKLEKMYGFGSAGANAQVGTLEYDFAEHNEAVNG